MTLEEAAKIAAVLETADNYCQSCARDLCDQMNHVFSEFKWRINSYDKPNGCCTWGVFVEINEVAK